MRTDNEGFLYPYVDFSQCINCNLCEKVCPVIHPQVPLDIQAAYGFKNPSKEIRQQSSSGGFFSKISEFVLKQNGVVFGSRYDKDWNVIIDYTEDINGLSMFRGSKYVQSQNNNTFYKAKQFLKTNRLVLYSGTPCQIAALKNYLQKDYDNLITLDFICHGVPSPGVWKKYLNEITTNSKTTLCHKDLSITDINFREKIGYGWEKYGFTIRVKSNSETISNPILLSQSHSDNPFMKAFLNNIIIRPSCSACPAKAGRSHSDASMADFWGIKEISPKFYDKNGVSLIFAHNEKGNNIIKKLGGEQLEVSCKDVSITNISYSHSSPLHTNRTLFFSKWHSESIITLMNTLSKPSLTDQVKYLIRLALIKTNLNYKLNKLLKR